jgi:hypothetical protein
MWVFDNRVPEENIWTLERGSSNRRMELHNEELHNLYSSLSIIRQVKSRRMWWAGHVARMGEERLQGFEKARRKETTRKTEA